MTDDGFAITLNFGDNPEPLYIPYDAIRTFVDPSVEFGLRFETQEIDAEEMEEDDDALSPTEAEITPLEKAGTDKPEGGPKPNKEAEIVSLDKFRK
mgnify:CR=1 FL=1